MLSSHDIFGSDDSDSDDEVDADASRSPGAATTASDRRAEEIIARGEELLAMQEVRLPENVEHVDATFRIAINVQHVSNI